MKVTIINDSSIKITNKLIENMLKNILEKEKIESDEVILNFVDKKKIKKLHLKFFNNPEPTDCITIPIDKPKDKKSGYHILGEAFICPDVALENAKRFKTSIFYELNLYIIHTILHLIGYDDIKEKDIVLMRKKENFYLTLFKEKNILLN